MFLALTLATVLVVIGIIVAVGTVAYTGYTARAKDTTLKNNHNLVLE